MCRTNSEYLHLVSYYQTIKLSKLTGVIYDEKFGLTFLNLCCIFTAVNAAAIEDPLAPGEIHLELGGQNFPGFNKRDALANGIIAEVEDGELLYKQFLFNSISEFDISTLL